VSQIRFRNYYKMDSEIFMRVRKSTAKKAWVACVCYSSFKFFPEIYAKY